MDDAVGDGGRQDVLREIAGASPAEEPLPDVMPEEPEPPAPPSPEDPPSASLRTPVRPSWWARHRHELAGLVTAGVSLVWISLGIASRGWGPSLIGVLFALGALLIGSRAVWAAD
ncbi:MAG TPA: hypothetical protein VKW04_10110 [Planctomycetota bacterium]|nr:hypothetical protein [Planctomycetota bacterium]